MRPVHAATASRLAVARLCVAAFQPGKGKGVPLLSRRTVSRALTPPARAQSPSPESTAAAKELIDTINLANQFKNLVPVIMKNLKPAIVQGRSNVDRDYDAMMPVLLEAFLAAYRRINRRPRYHLVGLRDEKLDPLIVAGLIEPDIVIHGRTGERAGRFWRRQGRQRGFGGGQKRGRWRQDRGRRYRRPMEVNGNALLPEQLQHHLCQIGRLRLPALDARGHDGENRRQHNRWYDCGEVGHKSLVCPRMAERA
jgi:hypothetical protein